MRPGQLITRASSVDTWAASPDLLPPQLPMLSMGLVRSTKVNCLNTWLEKDSAHMRNFWRRPSLDVAAACEKNEIWTSFNILYHASWVVSSWMIPVGRCHWERRKRRSRLVRFYFQAVAGFKGSVYDLQLRVSLGKVYAVYFYNYWYTVFGSHMLIASSSRF